MSPAGVSLDRLLSSRAGLRFTGRPSLYAAEGCWFNCRVWRRCSRAASSFLSRAALAISGTEHDTRHSMLCAGFSLGWGRPFDKTWGHPCSMDGLLPHFSQAAAGAVTAFAAVLIAVTSIAQPVRAVNPMRHVRGPRCFH